MKKLTRIVLGVVIVGGLALNGCGEFKVAPKASGPSSEITVVADSVVWNGPVGDAIRQQLEQPILTLPEPEPLFNVVHWPLRAEGTYHQIRKRKNVLFVAALDDSTATGDYIRGRLSGAVTRRVEAGEMSLFPRRNLWYRDQLVHFVTAPDEAALARAIRSNGERLRYRYRELVLGRMREQMFDGGWRDELADSLRTRHGFSLRVLHGYRIVEDTTQFVRLRNTIGQSWRDLFVYYIDGADREQIRPEWIYRTRDSLTQRNVRGTIEGAYVQIDRRRPLRTRHVRTLGPSCLESRGLWHMSEGAKGGPFLTYTCYSPKQERIYMIDGMIHAPGYNKRALVRRLEVMARSFEVESNLNTKSTAKSSPSADSGSRR